jgi:hypothetical protein
MSILENSQMSGENRTVSGYLARTNCRARERPDVTNSATSPAHSQREHRGG